MLLVELSLVMVVSILGLVDKGLRQEWKAYKKAGETCFNPWFSG